MVRPVQVPLYVFWVLVVLATGAPVGSIYASTQIANHNQQSAIESARIAADRQREVNRLQSCELFGRLIDVYEETPPSTPAGRNVEKAYREYYNGQLLCVPPRPKE